MVLTLKFIQFNILHLAIIYPPYYAVTARTLIFVREIFHQAQLCTFVLQKHFVEFVFAKDRHILNVIINTGILVVTLCV